jgi:tetratricopeptide (TPR) repeat protein
MTRTGKLRESLPILCLVAAGLISAAFLTAYIERTKPPLPEGFGDDDLSMQGARLKGFAFGMEGLLADWYWIRTLQYVGDKLVNTKLEVLDLEDLRPLNPRLVEPYLRNSTDLDPHFMAPYSYGAIVLPSIDKQKAIELTQKGIANNPDAWRLYQYLGYIFWKLGRYEEASEAYSRGAQVPGAAKFLNLMAAAMKSKGGSRETAQAIYRQMYEEGDDTNIKYAALLRWQQLMALDEMEVIDATLAEFREKRGRCPSTLREIVPMLNTARLPDDRDFHLNNNGDLADPRGDAYQLNSSCKVELNAASPLPKS